jgi:hypothetical protein
MRFGYGCPHGHEIVENFPIGKAPDSILCHDHDLEEAPRVFDVPYFVEDRLRMRPVTANNPNPEWSWTLGGPAPQSRAERRLLEKVKGIEFVTPSEAKADAAKLRSGKNLDEPKKLEKGYLAKEIAKRGIRFDRSLSQPQQLTREQSERKLEAERGWGSTEDAQAKVVSADKLPA